MEVTFDLGVYGLVLRFGIFFKKDSRELGVKLSALLFFCVGNCLKRTYEPVGSSVHVVRSVEVYFTHTYE